MRYELIISSCKTDGSVGSMVYGLRNTGCPVYFPYEDISTNREDVIRLIALLERGNVELDQLSYVIEDYIACL